MGARLLVVLLLALLFTMAPALLAPIAMAVGPTMVLVAFAAGCLTLAAVI